MKKITLIFALAIGIFAQPAISLAQQQNPPFYAEIQAFKEQDAVNPPPKNAIVFVGSSSFKGWRDVQDYFPGYTIINRGFGGSSTPDAIRYANDIVIPYQPKQVVIYVGENDFPAAGVTADTVFNRFTKLFNVIRKGLPKANILFVSYKPSPSRLKFMPEMVRANAMVKQFLAKQKRTGYVDVYSKMLLPDGSPMPDIFKADKLHMTADGYKIWAKEIQPKLLK